MLVVVCSLIHKTSGGHFPKLKNYDDLHKQKAQPTPHNIITSIIIIIIMPTWMFKRQRALVAATQAANDIATTKRLLNLAEITSDQDAAMEEQEVRGEEALPVEAAALDVREALELSSGAAANNNNKTMFLDSWIPDVIADQDTGMVAMFNELWHELEAGPVQMVATDPQLSMVAMFRETGHAASLELESGRRVLTTTTMAQIKWAIQQAMEMLKHTPLLMSAFHQDDRDRNIFLADTMFEI